MSTSYPSYHFKRFYACGQHIMAQCRCLKTDGSFRIEVTNTPCPAGCAPGSGSELETSLSAAQRALACKVEEVQILHQLHGEALQALAALAAAVAPGLHSNITDASRFACLAIDEARRQHRSALLGEREQMRGLLKARIPEASGYWPVIDAVLDRMRELDGFAERILAASTERHLKGCADAQTPQPPRNELEAQVRESEGRKVCQRHGFDFDSQQLEAEELERRRVR